MTTEDKELLLNFVTLIGMHIQPVTAENAINFIRGYEAGTRNTCAFTQQLQQLLTDTYQLSYSNDGWPGQIRRLAKRRTASWLTVFRNLTLELIVLTEGGKLTVQQQAILQPQIRVLIDRLRTTPATQLDAYWGADWLALCPGRRSWFKQLWTKQEWRIITHLDKVVKAQLPANVA
ncbi:MAG: hypothetical protein EOO60_01805 [Hymenobacter sp.]|nr:MAG: hypothetical protein EOO60_01805 [Hymenobacter sp.]